MKTEKNPVAPLIVIVGVTASGKSALSMEIAKKYNGEIICADSRTVYRGMDIGTAKPSEADRFEIPHHMLDIIDVDEFFTAAEFKRQSTSIIKSISDRGKLPIIVGGTGLYVDGVIFDYAFLPPVPLEEREYLQSLSIGELQEKIRDLGIRMPENSKNPRHLIRAIETNGAVPVKKSIREHTLMLGIDADSQTIRERISKRVDHMLSLGLEDEVSMLFEKYPGDSPGLQSTGYKAFKDYIESSIGIDEAKQRFINNDYQLARRQRTWFKRNKSIHWIKSSSEADTLVNSFLQKYN